jgi:hypothetical protein
MFNLFAIFGRSVEPIYAFKAGAVLPDTPSGQKISSASVLYINEQPWKARVSFSDSKTDRTKQKFEFGMTVENYPKFMDETKARGAVVEKTILGAVSRESAMSMMGIGQHHLGLGLDWDA